MKDKDFVLGFRTVGVDGISRNGFKWPRRGPVSCNNFLPTRECGSGLHFLKNGNGHIDLTSLHDFLGNGLNMQVLKVPLRTKDDKNNIISLGGKSKCKECEVLYTGKDLRKVLSFTKNNFNKNLIRSMHDGCIGTVLESNKTIRSINSINPAYTTLFVMGDNITILNTNDCNIVNFGKNNLFQMVKVYPYYDIIINSYYNYDKNVISQHNGSLTDNFTKEKGNFDV